jgi:3-hydroxyacyl-CoA dehydrogenase
MNALVETRPLRKVVVLGANGTMGFRSGALFASAGLPVTFLARDREKAEVGREKAARAVRSTALKNKIDVGSYQDLAQAVADADLIFEALAEDFAIKAEIFERLDRCRKPDSLVATVSSGLSITDLAAPRSESFQRHFCGLHFFNPPQVIVGTELIAGEGTDPRVIDFLEAYSTKRLGRLVVRTANTAGFAGNRIGFKVLNECAQLAETHGPLVVDRLIGPYTGRALPPLATIDLVGWDVHKAIVDNVCDKLSDEAIATYRLPAYMQRMIDRGALGAKSGGGFFRRKRGEPLRVLDIRSGEYLPADAVALPEVPFVQEIALLHRVGEYRKGLELLLTAQAPEAALVRRVIAGYISYSFHRVGEVTETIAGIDGIMAAGFNWAPPSALVDLIGIERTVEMIGQAGVPVPALLRRALDRGNDHPLFHDPRLSLGKYFVAK